jgi:hypothetical protein
LTRRAVRRALDLTDLGPYSSGPRNPLFLKDLNRQKSKISPIPLIYKYFIRKLLFLKDLAILAR